MVFRVLLAVGVILGGIRQELIPLTLPKHLVPCDRAIDTASEFKRALDCSKGAIPGLPSDLAPPSCFLISASSPDVYRAPEGFNFITTGIDMRFQVVGFYDRESRTVYVVENQEAPQIFRHELQHYFLDAVGLVDLGHKHEVFNTCEPAYFTPQGTISGK